MTPPDLSLILPAFNEAAAIPKTIGEAKHYFESRRLTAEIIVPADGNDGTREIARDLGAIAMGSEQRRGKGLGIREAVAIASGRWIGYADADNKVPIEEFDRIRPWLDAGTEVVTGSRAMRESRIERRQPLYRRIGAKGFSVFMHTVVGLRGIHDTQCGFKFFQAAAARELFRRQRIDGYMFDVEILSIARRLGYRIEQVPIRWRDDADSRLELVRGNLRNAVDIFRIGLGAARR